MNTFGIDSTRVQPFFLELNSFERPNIKIFTCLLNLADSKFVNLTAKCFRQLFENPCIFYRFLIISVISGGYCDHEESYASAGQILFVFAEYIENTFTQFFISTQLFRSQKYRRKKLFSRLNFEYSGVQ